MTTADPLRAFTVAFLEDAGARVRDDGAFLWLELPEPLASALDLSSQACLTLDPDRAGAFDAELVAPGSYLLEKLLALATARGRWDVSRLVGVREDWVLKGLREAGMAVGGPAEVLGRAEEALALFAFRTTLVSDEKRETFQLLAATLDGADSWPVPWPLDEERLAPASLPGFAPDLGLAYARSCAALAEQMAGEVEAFRRVALAALEEEVRRIFRYFDGTVAEVREAAGSGAEDVVRAIEAERDRRLAEALERFEPHASASLCSVRLVLVPTARVTRTRADGASAEMRIDALTGHVRA